MPQAASIAHDEIKRFSAQAKEWWNPEGAFRPLHRLNPVRLAYVRDRICAHFGREAQSRDSLKGLKILDVGCGGGLMAEPMARLGADVTGLDASESGIAAARAHAGVSGLNIDYRAGSVEALAKTKARFDVITALEIVEHVADLEAFFAALTTLLKPEGILILSTLNRTPQSFLLGIVAAEYILRWVPRGTHDWRKFLRPSEMARHLEGQGLKLTDMTGLEFSPLANEFRLNKQKLDVNYLMTAIKG